MKTNNYAILSGTIKPSLLLQLLKLLILSVFLVSIVACVPMTHPSGPVISTGQLSNNVYITPDGSHLPLKKWHTRGQKTKAIIIAVHGFNDYSHFFQQAGSYLSQHQIITYAYDQRGFGGSPHRGLWAGINTYIADLESFIQLVKYEHPAVPVFILGHSMGGAIVISAMSQPSRSSVKGIILVAPAVWSRQTMPWYQNLVLWTLSHTVPWMTLTGQDMGITPSDNIEMLRAMSQDPLIIKETRIESIYGLVNLMDQAYYNAPLISTNTLLLYGEKDEVIPKEPTYQFLKNLPDTRPKHTIIAFYKNGYHMLLRDLDAPILWHDIDFWINSLTTPLPSRADKRAQKLLNNQD